MNSFDAIELKIHMSVCATDHNKFFKSILNIKRCVVKLNLKNIIIKSQKCLCSLKF